MPASYRRPSSAHAAARAKSSCQNAAVCCVARIQPRSTSWSAASAQAHAVRVWPSAMSGRPRSIDIQASSVIAQPAAAYRSRDWRGDWLPASSPKARSRIARLFANNGRIGVRR